MRRFPILLVATLLAMWLLLAVEISFAQVTFGLLLAVLLVLAIARLRPVRPRVRRPHLIVTLALTVVVDILRSNVAVARIVLGLVRDRQVHSGFLEIPLELRDPHALAVLSVIVTSTPGTSWAGLSPDGGTLRLHVLDLQDESEWISLIKERYERPLREIFE